MGDSTDPRRAKQALRRVLIARRRAMSGDERRAAADAVRAHVLAAAAVKRAAVVAAYAPTAAEPGDLALLDALRAAGKTVLLPVVAPRRRLLWRAYRGELADGPWGLREPPATASGDAGGGLGDADLVLAPALAADRVGHRLGRGGGFYDRELGAARPGVQVAVLLHDGELLDHVPHEPHDRPAHAAITPRAGWTALGGPQSPTPASGPTGTA